ncbi:ABC transporter substrate-binding protein [Rhodobacteraceae bacterium KMS-5]|uniref:ABC transporter substrate-binding protein n=2 Tax=Tabrizicola oligotrophica TaxID=2710650 RepID=A0A6M0QQG6_9RHOB|nr:extracellular solute-binding protein [Tabrizicola oligotrophica]NEY89014.1 ABC transporter substrate-binding protein [Tabrizicola oligotrophica]
MYGQPALPPDFVSLPYANPDAPKGGRLTLGESGGFDSLNPFIVKGQAPGQLTALTVETLMGRSVDEPFTLYGLLAESVETDEARSFVEFTLRPEARFSDGSPVTVEDVLWSFETLGTLGSPRYQGAWKKIAKAEATGARKVRFTFNVQDRELPLILGLRPVLKKAQWQGKAFDEASLDAPIGSGPYVVSEALPGQSITYARNPDWWGKDLPFNRGLHNLDEIRIEYFGTAATVFEAFRAGELTLWRETNPAKWQVNFAYPAVSEGKVKLAELAHQRPSGIEGFAMNTRNPLFADWRVREALILAFNFELVNANLNAGAVPRIASYFSNSPLSGEVAGPATGKVLELLQPFAADLPPGTLEGYALPVSDGSEANRKNLRQAVALLEEAGWHVVEGQLVDATGAPFAFEILLQNGADDMIATANIYVEALKRLGITARVQTVDAAMYKERVNDFSFDMTHLVRALSLSPGNEQKLYWGAEQASQPGSRNLPGIQSAAVDAMIDQMLATTDPETFRAATMALDRVLTAGRYVVPIWYADRDRIAHDARLHYPDHLPLYGFYPGFNPETFWIEE